MVWKASDQEIAAIDRARQTPTWGQKDGREPLPEEVRQEGLWFGAWPAKEQKANRADRTLTSDISTIDPDEDNEVVLPKGMDRGHFDNGGPVLFGHYGGGVLPGTDTLSVIGRAEWIKSYDGGRVIRAKTQFAPSPFAQQVYEFMAAEPPYFNGWSIGFLIKAAGEPTEEEIKDNPKWENVVRRVVRQWKLLEYSAVPIPANPKARTLSIKASKLAGYDPILVESLKLSGVQILEDTEDGDPDGDEFGGNGKGVLEIATKPGWEETDTSFRRQIRLQERFDEDSFKTVPIKEEKPRVTSVQGHLKGETTMTVQSLIFPKEDGWNLSDAKSWYNDHKDSFKSAEELGAEPRLLKGRFIGIGEARLIVQRYAAARRLQIGRDVTDRIAVRKGEI